MQKIIVYIGPEKEALLRLKLSQFPMIVSQAIKDFGEHQASLESDRSVKVIFDKKIEFEAKNKIGQKIKKEIEKEIGFVGDYCRVSFD